MGKEKVKKPWYKKWWVWVIAVIVVIAISSGGDEEEKETVKEEPKKEQKAKKPAEEPKEDTTAYTAENVYNWFLESGLISGDKKEDDTADFKGSEGIVKVIDAGEVSISEFEKPEQAAKYATSDITIAHKNIYILLVKGQSQRDSFIKVLEAGKPLTDLTASYVSEEQKKVAELMASGSDFLPVVETYYALPSDQKTVTWRDFMEKRIVTWSGTIADLEAIGDSIVVYGGENYTGESWTTISTEKKEMLPYTFIVELKDKSIKNGLKHGDKVTLKASLDSRGDKEMQFNWKLYEGEVIN
ncbi:hypothetical protein ABLO26_25405 [Neobacillus sp. 179-J 1A1 HS]|uniref:hypothetical protein n=1 Tax=Neobacillus driksii TaxID=3035913 RepID=UPI0035BC16BF